MHLNDGCIPYWDGAVLPWQSRYIGVYACKPQCGRVPDCASMHENVCPAGAFVPDNPADGLSLGRATSDKELVCDDYLAKSN